MRPWLRSLRIVAGAAGLLALVAWPAHAGEGRSLMQDWVMPESISTYGDRVDAIFNLILVITGVTFLATEGILLYESFAFIRQRGMKAQYIHGSHKLEMWWTIIPAVILFFLAISQTSLWSEVKMRDLSVGDAYHVRVMAKQFEWNFLYPGPDGKFDTADDVFSINELRIPVHQQVFLQMRSYDVIHSLYLPYVRFKQDVVPGMTVSGWVEITKTTAMARLDRKDPNFEYEIACAELCGNQHYSMRARLTIEEAPEIQRWQAEFGKRKLAKPEIWKEWENSGGVIMYPETPEDEHAEHGK